MSEMQHMPSLVAAVFSGAGVVLFGACYALLFALGRLTRRPRLLAFGYLAFACLLGSATVLAMTLALADFWRVVIVVMVAGYFLAPHLIWRLCVGTHGEVPARPLRPSPPFPAPRGGSR